MNEETLAGRLERWATERGDRRALTFLDNGESEAGHLTFSALHDAAHRIGGALTGHGARGGAVLILARGQREFVTAVLGCLVSGAIAVPCSVGPRGRGQDRIRSVAADACPVLALGDAEGAASLPEEVRPPFLHVADCLSAPLPDAQAARRDEPVLLQYTSGSTASPKGVVVTQRNLAGNLAMLQSGFAVREDSVYLNWLPLFHDMGLIGNLLAAIWSGVACVLMSPLSFYQKPQRWLSAVSRYGATISGGPNFAYDLCVRRRDRMDLTGIDLSRWSLAFCGAEPVRAATMRNFADAFATAGFRAGALFPCYGLAEATVFVTGGRPGSGICTMVDETGRELVGCGRAAPGGEVVVVDPDARRPVPDGTLGEVWVRGEHVARGYWDRPELTPSVFEARLDPEDGRAFLRTGDLGLMMDGEVFLRSRLKDLIIWQGTNLHPEDLESAAASAHPACATTNTAFPVETADGEGVVIVQEIARSAVAEDGADAVLRALSAAMAATHGVFLHDALLVPPGSVPRTTSGKVQRRACRQLYEQGALSSIAVARLADRRQTP